MSIRHRPDLEERGSVLWRSVVVLLLVGVGLGLITNAVLLASGSKRGIAWVRTEKDLVDLEDLVANAPATPAPQTTASPEGTEPVDPIASTPVSTEKDPAASKPATAPAGGESPKPAQNPPAAGTTAPPNAEKSVPTGAAKSVPAADVPTVPESREPIEAKTPMVKRFFDANAALFVDAREAVEYAEGHIAGSVNLSFDEVFKDAKKLDTIDPKGRPIIVYCGGGDCEASKNLAYQLIDAGHKKVVVYTDGYPAWTSAGYPIVKGAEPGAAK